MSAQEQARHGVIDAMSKRRNALRVPGRREFSGIPQSAGIARRWVVDLLSAHVLGEVLEMIELLVGEVDLLASAWGIGGDDEAGGVLWFQLPHDTPTLS